MQFLSKVCIKILKLLYVKNLIRYVIFMLILYKNVKIALC